MLILEVARLPVTSPKVKYHTVTQPIPDKQIFTPYQELQKEHVHAGSAETLAMVWDCGEVLTLNKDKSHQERLQFILELQADNSPYKIEELPNELNTLPVIQNMHDKAKGLVLHKIILSAGEH